MKKTLTEQIRISLNILNEANPFAHAHADDTTLPLIQKINNINTVPPIINQPINSVFTQQEMEKYLHVLSKWIGGFSRLVILYNNYLEKIGCKENFRSLEPALFNLYKLVRRSENAAKNNLLDSINGVEDALNKKIKEMICAFDDLNKLMTSKNNKGYLEPYQNFYNNIQIEIKQVHKTLIRFDKYFHIITQTDWM